MTKFRLARNLFVHTRVDTDSISLDQDSIKRMVVRAALWLTPKSVAGFNAAHFPELGTDRQLELQRLVKEFREIARSVPPNKPATGDQYDSATLVFRKLLEILDPYLFSPQEGKQVEEALKKVEFPSWALNWDYELGSDPDGTPSVLVTIFVDDESATAPRAWPLRLVDDQQDTHCRSTKSAANGGLTSSCEPGSNTKRARRGGCRRCTRIC